MKCSELAGGTQFIAEANDPPLERRNAMGHSVDAIRLQLVASKSTSFC